MISLLGDCCCKDITSFDYKAVIFGNSQGLTNSFQFTIFPPFTQRIDLNVWEFADWKILTSIDSSFLPFGQFINDFGIDGVHFGKVDYFLSGVFVYSVEYFVRVHNA